MAKLIRVKEIFGRGKPIPVGQTKFLEDYVHNPRGPEEQFIPGTNVPRLKLVKIGPRAVAAFDDEIDALIEALRAERDARHA
jgi:hypothetical protein